MIAAVITGDIINSTAETDFFEKLHLVLQDVSATFRLNQNSTEIYRGDSFQCVTENPAEALMVVMCIRAGLRSTTYYPGFPKPFDAKTAIGIGNVSSLRNKPGESAGDAFLFSGRTLDELQGKKFHMGIRSDRSTLDPLADAVLRFINDIMVGWSGISADTACHHWFSRLNQEQLAAKLGISQPAVNKRLQAARIQLLEHADKNFRLTLKRLYNDRTSHTV